MFGGCKLGIVLADVHTRAAHILNPASLVSSNGFLKASCFPTQVVQQQFLLLFLEGVSCEEGASGLCGVDNDWVLALMLSGFLAGLVGSDYTEAVLDVLDVGAVHKRVLLSVLQLHLLHPVQHPRQFLLLYFVVFRCLRLLLLRPRPLLRIQEVDSLRRAQVAQREDLACARLVGADDGTQVYFHLLRA